MSGLYDPDGIAFVLSGGIFVVGGLLSVLSFLAWRREHDRKLLTVTVAYVLFALRGSITIVQHFFHPLLDPETLQMSSSPMVGIVSLLDHLSALLILVGLVLFFVALTRG